MLPVQHQIKNLNRPGLIAAMCREMKIADYLDMRITNAPDARNVITGEVVVARLGAIYPYSFYAGHVIYHIKFQIP